MKSSDPQGTACKKAERQRLDRAARKARNLALALYIDGLVRGGEVENLATVARMCAVSRAKVARVAGMTGMTREERALLFLSRAYGRAGSRGGSVNNRLTVGIEGAGWSHQVRVEYDTDEHDIVTWAFAMTTLSLIWYPHGGGLLIRGGAGWGRAHVRVEHKAEVSDVTESTETAHDAGPTLLVGLGYEWRLARRLALVPSLDYGAMDLGAGWKANIADVTLGMTWYL